jgi:hypothetical protein
VPLHTAEILYGIKEIFLASLNTNGGEKKIQHLVLIYGRIEQKKQGKENGNGR